jgi:hypothetical protein
MSGFSQSSKRHPCPICGRTRDGDCRQRNDGQMLLCHRGKTLGPPANLRVGDVLTDDDGRHWAYTGDSGGDREAAVFVIHTPVATQDYTLPACGSFSPPAPAPVGGEEPYTATVYQYRDDLRIIRCDYERKKKSFQPQFFFNGRWNAGAGSEIWPFYGSLGSQSEFFAIEVEGEKCVDVLRSVGIAAITHPGHQRDEASCRARYAGLLQVGIAKVYFVSDNDAAGRKKAAGFQGAAQLAGVELCVIPAESIFNVPDGGSVDDMPADQLESLLRVAIRSATGAKPTPLNRISYDKIKQQLKEFREKSSFSHADIQAGIADIASAHNASAFDVRRIWDSLEEDSQVAQEALSATVAITRRQELEERRKSLLLEDYLPEFICPAVRELTASLPCDSLTAAAVVLTTVAGVLKAGHILDVGDGIFTKHPVIWLLLGGASGSGKSPIMRHLGRERLGMVFSHYNQISIDEEMDYDTRYGHLPKARRPEKPEPLAALITDFTTESLIRILADNHKHGLGTMIYSEEIKEVLGNFDEHKAHGKGRGKETFLCLFDGNVNAQHRIGRRSKQVEGKVQNALLGAVQPGVFRKMIEEGDDAGLFARCLVVPVVSDYIEPNFMKTPEELQAVYLAQKTIESFYLRCLGVAPRALRLERDAVDLFVLLHKDTYDKIQAVSLESQRAVLGKRLGYILQVALVMHLARIAVGEINPSEQYVSKATLARAVILVDLLQAYAIVEQQESQMQRHGSFDLTRKVHVYARTKGGCTPSEFANNCIPVRHKRNIKSTHVKAAMEQLVAMGLGEWKNDADPATSKQIFVALGKFPD